MIGFYPSGTKWLSNRAQTSNSYLRSAKKTRWKTRTKQWDVLKLQSIHEEETWFFRFLWISDFRLAAVQAFLKKLSIRDRHTPDQELIILKWPMYNQLPVSLKSMILGYCSFTDMCHKKKKYRPRQCLIATAILMNIIWTFRMVCWEYIGMCNMLKSNR